MHLWGITIFRRKFFVSQCRKLLWASLQCFRTIGILKKFMHIRGYHNYLSKFFCLFLPKNFLSIPWIFLKNWGIEKFLCTIGGITIFRRNIFVSQCRKLLLASLQCFRTIGILKNSMHTRGYHVSPSKLFGLTVPKKFVGIPSIFQKSWDIENFYALMGYHNFPSKNFVSQCRKLLWASLQCFREIAVSKNFMQYGGYHNFLSKLFGLTVPKKIVGIPSIFQKSWGIGNCYAVMGYHNFPSKNFVSQCRKIS